MENGKRLARLAVKLEPNDGQLSIVTVFECDKCGEYDRHVLTIDNYIGDTKAEFANTLERLASLLRNHRFKDDSAFSGCNSCRLSHSD